VLRFINRPKSKKLIGNLPYRRKSVKLHPGLSKVLLSALLSIKEYNSVFDDSPFATDCFNRLYDVLPGRCDII
jgi:hypothetical protein